MLGALVRPAEPVADAAEPGHGLDRIVRVARLLVGGRGHGIVLGRLGPGRGARPRCPGCSGRSRSAAGCRVAARRPLPRGPGPRHPTGSVLVSRSPRLARPIASDWRSPSCALDRQGLLEQLPGPAQVAVVHLEQGHVVERGGQRRGGHRARPAVPSPSRSCAGPRPGRPGSGSAEPSTVAAVAVRSGTPSGSRMRSASLRVPDRGSRSRRSQPPGPRTSTAHGPRARRGARRPARGIGPASAANGEAAADKPPAPQRGADVEAQVDLGVLVGPRQRHVQVGNGGFEAGCPVGRVGATEARLAARRDPGEMQRVPPPGHRAVAGPDQLERGEGPDRLQHVELVLLAAAGDHEPG